MSRFTISKRFEFSASHRLAHLPEDHPCARLHGHNYTVELELNSHDLNEVGFVYDYRRMNGFKRWLDDTLDHQHLNDILEQPTSELLAQWLYGEAAVFVPVEIIAAVRVYETPKTCAEYRPKPAPTP